jgi:hypothetical protein
MTSLYERLGGVSALDAAVDRDPVRKWNKEDLYLMPISFQRAAAQGDGMKRSGKIVVKRSSH